MAAVAEVRDREVFVRINRRDNLGNLKFSNKRSQLPGQLQFPHGKWLTAKECSAKHSDCRRPAIVVILTTILGIRKEDHWNLLQYYHRICL
ncbi:AAEL004115-PA [Aedes aegypti]|uniref:AAEL004115-PA n=1 Tax=Aedes aegypti TaxID=7159 RepID=Q17DL8_AEDAE|nr:AAEL004115-PA [Aedes aegypti]